MRTSRRTPAVGRRGAAGSFSLIEVLVAFVVVALASASCYDFLHSISAMEERSVYYQACVEYTRRRFHRLLVEHRPFLGKETGSFKAGRLEIAYELEGREVRGFKGLGRAMLSFHCKHRPFAVLRFETMISDRLRRRPR